MRPIHPAECVPTIQLSLYVGAAIIASILMNSNEVGSPKSLYSSPLTPARWAHWIWLVISFWMVASLCFQLVSRKRIWTSKANFFLYQGSLGVSSLANAGFSVAFSADMFGLCQFLCVVLAVANALCLVTVGMNNHQAPFGVHDFAPRSWLYLLVRAPLSIYAAWTLALVFFNVGVVAESGTGMSCNAYAAWEGISCALGLVASVALKDPLFALTTMWGNIAQVARLNSSNTGSTTCLSEASAASTASLCFTVLGFGLSFYLGFKDLKEMFFKQSLEEADEALEDIMTELPRKEMTVPLIDHGEIEGAGI
eukprot:gnl/Chilomastix_cuspidata/4397.p1 GENE.gnl/Chilomastix_cuspidata/4397~~gnl/Chilomastix_cuspidata/4397.p1  ORF type:complete len:310 (-),score=59.32 gnl/Chilomastix_cuspidata/4397:49-978(-)